MTDELAGRALAALDRFLNDDSLMALELLALDQDKYPEMVELQSHILGIYLCITALKMRIIGHDVQKLPQGYIFTPPQK